MMSNNYYIYVHFKKGTDIPFYIGKGKNRRLKSKCGRNQYWYNIVNKYDFEAIKIEEGLSEEESNESEKYWIAQFKSWGFNLANMTDGGDGISGWKHSESSKKKMSESKKGRRLSPNTEFKKGMISLNKGKKHSKETKKKISDSKKGKKGYWTGKKRIFTLEHKMKLSHSIIINNIEYYSIKEASRETKIPESTIHYRLKNKQFKNYIFKNE